MRNYQIDTWIIELIPDSCTPQSLDVSFKDNNNGGNIVTTSYNVNPEVTTNGPTVTQIVLDIGTTLSNNGLTNILTDEITISFTSTGCSASGPIQIYAITLIGGPCDPITTSTTIAPTSGTNTPTDATPTPTTGTLPPTGETIAPSSVTEFPTVGGCDLDDPFKVDILSTDSQAGSMTSQINIADGNIYDEDGETFYNLGNAQNAKFYSEVKFAGEFELTYIIMEAAPPTSTPQCVPSGITVTFNDLDDGGINKNIYVEIIPDVASSAANTRVFQLFGDIDQTKINLNIQRVFTNFVTIQLEFNDATKCSNDDVNLHLIYIYGCPSTGAPSAVTMTPTIKPTSDTSNPTVQPSGETGIPTQFPTLSTSAPVAPSISPTLKPTECTGDQPITAYTTTTQIGKNGILTTVDDSYVYDTDEITSLTIGDGTNNEEFISTVTFSSTNDLSLFIMEGTKGESVCLPVGITITFLDQDKGGVEKSMEYDTIAEIPSTYADNIWQICIKFG